MGETISKMQETACTKFDEHIPPPRYHFKCRYHKEDEHCDHKETNVYTRTTDIYRDLVPFDKIKWSTPLPDYSPVNFTSKKILTKDGATYKDPDIIDAEFSGIKFNEIDRKYKVDRKSHHGPFEFFVNKLDNNKTVLVPRNPVGRTGLTGRGHLGRWGCNHAADPIVTTWLRNERGKVVFHQESGRPILKFVAIQRRDTGKWAIPGGMRDPGEVITKTLVREFAEEALDYAVKYDKHNKIDDSASEMNRKLNSFFKNGILIYKGYVDDPRNTDNSWMETIACNFHDKNGDIIGNIELKGGDDAKHAKWLTLDSSLELFASHRDFLQEVATIHDAHW